MTDVLTQKRNGILEGLNSLGKYFLSAHKTIFLITGGIGGLLIVAVLLFPVFLIVSFLLKLFGF
jgi:hypothetical protein